MGIGPLSHVQTSLPAASAAPAMDDLAIERQVVMAVQRLNQSGILEGRELKYRRDPKTGRLVIQLRDLESGDVVDQIPPESVLTFLEAIEQQLAPKEE